MADDRLQLLAAGALLGHRRGSAHLPRPKAWDCSCPPPPPPSREAAIGGHLQPRRCWLATGAVIHGPWGWGWGELLDALCSAEASPRTPGTLIIDGVSGGVGTDVNGKGGGMILAGGHNSAGSTGDRGPGSPAKPPQNNLQESKSQSRATGAIVTECAPPYGMVFLLTEGPLSAVHVGCTHWVRRGTVGSGSRLLAFGSRGEGGCKQY